ncbi:tRNA pseudouridine(54/55) synthase Pus10 [Candidatus Micrarchaeota archaeon]|nr:tRNA pseudouridine(54/55) synthase Pus10 [Candidatus Micrarchaeota archaeon]
MFLCEICNSANCKAFETGECHICQGKATQTPEMIKKAEALLEKEDAKSFSLSTRLPKDWMTREEDVWDLKICRETQSMKNLLNKRISGDISNAAGLEYSKEGDVRLVFDYRNGEVSVRRNDLFVFGRYKKLKPGLSQSRWPCRKCGGKGCPQCGGRGKNYDSVEERIGDPFKKDTGAESYVIHASGREDVDATNTAGRPFVLEISAPENRNPDLGRVADAIKASGEVEAEDLKIVDRSFVELVTESHFDKTYLAEVKLGRGITGKEAGKIESLTGQTILQRTPARVSHRRADLVRHRKVKNARVLEKRGDALSLEIKAEAGTYIKELISGDKGRTSPSIAGMLSTEAECKRLEVTEINDGFIDFCIQD